MKSAIYERYGPAEVVELRDAPRPEAGEGEILVKVHATAVTTADWRLRASAFPGVMWLPGRLMFGLFRPRNQVLGADFAGKVVAVGPGVARFRPGDRVFGFAGQGAHAEYLTMSAEGAVARTPEGLNDEAAAAVPFGALAALVFLRDFAKVRAGERVLVHGASGGVGVFAVQIAKAMGAEVAAVASAANLDLLRSLGADRVIDYARDDFTQGAETYDVVLDTVGKVRFADARRVLRPNGRFVPLEFGFREIIQALATALAGGRRVVIGVSADRREDLELIAGMLERGEIRPVIDGRYPLSRIVEAHRRVESRRKRGSVVVTVADAEVEPAAA